MKKLYIDEQLFGLLFGLLFDLLFGLLFGLLFDLFMSDRKEKFSSVETRTASGSSGLFPVPGRNRV
jgi:hypothetical protein